MTNRRKFIKQITAAAIAGSLPSTLTSQPAFFSKQKSTPNNDMIWADLLHISYNMWHDHSNVVWDNLPADTYSSPDFQPKTCMDARRWARGYRPFLTFDENTWDKILVHMVEKGMNMVVMDLGDAIKYNSHPEIAVENAWSTEKLRAKLSKMREMGIEPIPKLNFSTGHKAWLGEYSRMISTEKYYTVCKNLINEVIDLFDKPRFFHLGMDEETATHQKGYDYVVIRQFDLWWHDFYILTEEVEKNNVRPWIWSDYAWRNPEDFFKKMPKTVLQSNWYYGTNFDVESLTGLGRAYVELYNDLEAHGYDQVPTGSSHSNDQNMELTVKYCKNIIDPSRLYGFMTAPWRPTLAPCLDRHKETIDQISRAINKFYPK